MPDTKIKFMKQIDEVGSLTADFEERMKDLGQIFQNVCVGKAESVARFDLSPACGDKIMVDEAVQAMPFTHDVEVQTDGPQKELILFLKQHPILFQKQQQLPRNMLIFLQGLQHLVRYGPLAHDSRTRSA